MQKMGLKNHQRLMIFEKSPQQAQHIDQTEQTLQEQTTQ
jgi:hypothetical protein